MSFRYQISAENKCTAYCLGERYSPDFCLEAIKTISADAAFNPAYNFITDLRDVVTFDADYARLSHLATKLQPYYAALNPEVTYVILTDRDVQFGMARMFQQIIENSVAFHVHLSRDLPDAAAALGLEETACRQLLDETRKQA